VTSAKPIDRTGPRSDTRRRIVAASTELFGRHGYTGTGIKAILAASDAPFGSLYHFFPGGKEELGAEAIRTGGAIYLALVDAFFPEGVDVVEATGTFFEAAAVMIEATDYADACPIATVALEVASVSEPMRVASAEAFGSWLSVLERRFGEAGISVVRSHELAVELFCAIEGAFLLSRTTRDPQPILIAGRACVASVRGALSDRPRAPRRPERAPR
jgi:TetR/AcrR family transcriptional repressor of lmrAB and yxaGH operons